MRKLILSVFFLIFIFSNICYAKIYVCNVKSAVTFNNNIIKPLNNEELLLLMIKKLIFYEDQGVLQYGNENRWGEFKMHVLQKGSSSSDMIAIFVRNGVEGTPHNSLRIRNWKKSRPFLWDIEGDFIAGNCGVQGNRIFRAEIDRR